MSEVKPKILLVNFPVKEAEATQKATGADVYRGYLSNGGTMSVDRSGDQKPQYYFYFPVPPYECDMVFVNMDNYDASKTEFGDKQQSWGERERDNFRAYWRKRINNPIVYFIGDTKVGGMYQFAVPANLVNSSGVDTESVVTLDEARLPYSLFKDLQKQIVMPNTNYIETPSSDTLISVGTEAFYAIRNKNSDGLSVVFPKERYDSNLENVGIILLPQPKSLSIASTAMYKHFSGDDDNDEWIQGDEFYPSNELNQLTSEIATIIEEAKTAVDTRREKILQHKKDHGYLRDLVTTQGDVLVEAVYQVLTKVLGLKVVKSDDVNQGNPKEDLLVTYQGKDILLEIKGTNRQNASLKFTQQPLQHALRQGLKEVGLGLVLNHDFNTPPNKRKLAYNDKETKPLIADLHFIDTRVLLGVAKAVLDGNLPIEDANELLFGQTGRAVYSEKDEE